jgi:hypothetical protein
MKKPKWIRPRKWGYHRKECDWVNRSWHLVNTNDNRMKFGKRIYVAYLMPTSTYKRDSEGKNRLVARSTQHCILAADITAAFCPAAPLYFK